MICTYSDLNTIYILTTTCWTNTQRHCMQKCIELSVQRRGAKHTLTDACKRGGLGRNCNVVFQLESIEKNSQAWGMKR